MSKPINILINIFAGFYSIFKDIQFDGRPSLLVMLLDLVISHIADDRLEHTDGQGQKYVWEDIGCDDTRTNTRTRRDKTHG